MSAMTGRLGSRGERDRADRLDRPERGRYDRPDRYDDRPERMDRYEDSYRDRYDDRDRDYDRSRRSYGAEGLTVSQVEEVTSSATEKAVAPVLDMMEDLRGDISDSEKGIMDAIWQLSDKVDTISQPVAKEEEEPEEEEFFDNASVDQTAKEEILRAVGENKSLLNMIRQDMIAKEQEKAIAVPEEEESQDPEVTLETFDDLKSYTHMEVVKCYRNVQASTAEQNAKLLEEMKASLTSLKVVTILSLVISVASVALLVAFVFGII